MIESSSASAISKAHILVVDDNMVNCVFLQKALELHGFSNLLCVDSAESALECMNDFRPELVILDIMMAGMNGYECCKRIRENPKFNAIPVLIQTSLSEPEMRVKAFQAGATDFVSKPIYPQELCARVSVHLEKSASLKTLQLYKDRVEVELESARALQYAILPTPEDISDIKRRCNIDVAFHFHPSSEIGGDFWSMKSLFPHQIACWLVDFSGHGVAAALNAFRLQAYVKEYSTLAARPGEYVSHLNDKLLNLLLRGQFATMFYAIIDMQTNQLFYTCACAPNPIIMRKSSGTCEIIDGTGNPLGIGMHLYTTQSTAFNMGDVLLMYSDALIESPNANNEYITEAELVALLCKHRDASASEIKTALLDHFAAHTGNCITDDLTVVIFSRTSN